MAPIRCHSMPPALPSCNNHKWLQMLPDSRWGARLSCRKRCPRDTAVFHIFITGLGVKTGQLPPSEAWWGCAVTWHIYLAMFNVIPGPWPNRGLLRLGAASPPLAGSWAWSLKTGLAKELSKVQTSQLKEEACPGISEAQIRTHRTKAGIGCYQTQWGRGAKVGLPDTLLQRGVLATLRVDLIQTGSSDEGPGHK